MKVVIYRSDHGKDTRQEIKVALWVVSLVRALQEDIRQLCDSRGRGRQTLDRFTLQLDQLFQSAVVLGHVGQEHTSEICENVLLGNNDGENQVLQKLLVVEFRADDRFSREVDERTKSIVGNDLGKIKKKKEEKKN